MPLDWALTQMNLGNALRVLGSRESGTVRLEEAVTAYRGALEEMTRDRVPPQWALTQMNLGSALSMLGSRESGTARLEEAVTAWDACLTAELTLTSKRPPPLAAWLPRRPLQPHAHANPPNNTPTAPKVNFSAPVYLD